MKKSLIISLILSLLFSNLSYAQPYLYTSIKVFPLKKYNVAIVGNSHASYSSQFLQIDNDIDSFMLSNHGVGGDDLGSGGFYAGAQITTAWNKGSELIAVGGDCKGLLHSFIDESNDYDYAILWFGSNSLMGDIDKFKLQYENYIKGVRAKGDKCKLILMQIPYMKLASGSEINEEFPDVMDEATYKKYTERMRVWNRDYKDTNDTYYYWDKVLQQEIPVIGSQIGYHLPDRVDKFNKVIKEVVEEFKDQDVYYQELPKEITYVGKDKAHLSKETYTENWENIKKRFNIELKVEDYPQNLIKEK